MWLSVDTDRFLLSLSRSLLETPRLVLAAADVGDDADMLALKCSTPKPEQAGGEWLGDGSLGILARLALRVCVALAPTGVPGPVLRFGELSASLAPAGVLGSSGSRMRPAADCADPGRDADAGREPDLEVGLELAPEPCLDAPIEMFGVLRRRSRVCVEATLGDGTSTASSASRSMLFTRPMLGTLVDGDLSPGIKSLSERTLP